MRRAVLTVALGVALAAMAFWATGGLEALQGWAADGQRRFQDALARALRALRAGDAGALAGLWGVAFAYGFFHAVGPGHGKFLLGAYGAGTSVPLGRMMGIGLVASLAQATTAVALVYGGVALFNLSRAQIEGITDAWLNPAGLVAVALLGGWLVWRGAHALVRAPVRRPATEGMAAAVGAGQAQAYDLSPAETRTTAARAAHAQRTGHSRHAHAHAGAPCADCGHHHLPDPVSVSRIGSLREAALVIGAIALRPCTGALFLLILTWRMGLEWAGVGAAYAMGLGTASVVVAVAALSVLAREGALSWSARIGAVARVLPVVEVFAGLLVIAVALGLLGAGI